MGSYMYINVLNDVLSFCPICISNGVKRLNFEEANTRKGIYTILQSCQVQPQRHGYEKMNNINKISLNAYLAKEIPDHI